RSGRGARDAAVRRRKRGHPVHHRRGEPRRGRSCRCHACRVRDAARVAARREARPSARVRTHRRCCVPRPAGKPGGRHDLLPALCEADARDAGGSPLAPAAALQDSGGLRHRAKETGPARVPAWLDRNGTRNRGPETVPARRLRPHLLADRGGRPHRDCRGSDRGCRRRPPGFHPVPRTWIDAEMTAEERIEPEDVLSPRDVLDFWFAAGADKWFVRDAEFDAEIAARFRHHHEAAKSGVYDDWQNTAEGALALIILLDQFARNIYRGTPQAFDADAHALEIARAA